jgi:hypothetical protein
MADQNILIKFGADTQEAVQDVNQLTKAIDGTDQATVDLNKSTQSLRAQLRGMQQDLAKMAVAGQQNTEQYKKLRNEAGLLQDAISDARREISNAGSDTRGLDKALRATTVLVGGFTALQGATALFGKQGEELQKTLIKINAAMSVLQGLQAIQNELTQKDSILTAAATKLKVAYTAATSGATVAVRALRIAMLGLVGGAVIAGIILLVKNWNKITDALGFTTKAVRELEKAQAALKAQNEAIDTGLEARIKLLKLQGAAQEEINAAERESLLLKRNLNIAEIARLQREARALEASIGGFSASSSLNPILLLRQKKRIEDLAILRAEITKLQDASVDYEVSLQTLNKTTDKQVVSQKELNKELKETEEVALGAAESLGSYFNTAKQGGVLDELARRVANLRQEMDRASGRPREGRGSQDSTRRDRSEDIEQEKEFIGYLVESLQFVSQLTSLIASARSARIQAEISDLERLRDEELKNADLTARQKEKIEERYQKQIAKLKTQQAIAQRRADITQAIINTSLAITQALGNPFRIALIAALGAAQIAIIARQPIPKFRKGGEITGSRHESGGVHIEAEGGEYMMRREAVDKYGKDFMKNINNLALPASVTAPQLSPNVINHINNKGIDHEKLAVTIGRELAKQPKVMIQMDEGGFQKSIQQGVKKTYYANRKFRAE